MGILLAPRRNAWIAPFGIIDEDDFAVRGFRIYRADKPGHKQFKTVLYEQVDFSDNGDYFAAVAVRNTLIKFDLDGNKVWKKEIDLDPYGPAEIATSRLGNKVACGKLYPGASWIVFIADAKRVQDFQIPKDDHGGLKFAFSGDEKKLLTASGLTLTMFDTIAYKTLWTTKIPFDLPPLVPTFEGGIAHVFALNSFDGGSRNVVTVRALSPLSHKGRASGEKAKRTYRDTNFVFNAEGKLVK